MTVQTFERWQLNREPRGWELVLGQKGRAWLNVVVGVAIVWIASWLRGRPDYAGFGLALLVFGVLWVLAGLAATRERRVVRITRDSISLERRKGRVADQWPLDRVATIDIERKRKKKRGDTVPFPWRIRIRDAAGARFRGKFKFQAEDTARAFAAELAGMLGVDVEDRTAAVDGSRRSAPDGLSMPDVWTVR